MGGEKSGNNSTIPSITLRTESKTIVHIFNFVISKQNKFVAIYGPA